MGFGGAGVMLVGTLYAANEQRMAADSARKDAKEGQRRTQNMEMTRDSQSRRQKIREERVRRSQIMQRAESMGAGQSSGEIGSLGSLATQTGSAIGSQWGQSIGAQGVSQMSQSAANHEASAQNWGAYGNVFQQGFTSMGGFSAFKPKAGGG